MSSIRVEVAYALPDKQHIAALEVSEGTTAMEAVRQSGIEAHFDDLIISDELPLGVFGKAVPSNHVLLAGERVEIYRPLKIDPKAVRRERAAKARTQREG